MQNESNPPRHARAQPQSDWLTFEQPLQPGVQPPPVAVPLPQASAGEPVALTWVGNPWDLTGLSFINFMLSIVTLGIYSFWGKTEVRRKIWSSVRLQGEPFAYTGTGGELFLGFLFAFGVVFMPILALTFAAVFILGPESPFVDLINIPIYVIIFLFMGVAIYRARRYRLTRTLWRGIRGGMSGSPKSFAWLWIWTSLLVAVTAGWFAPQRAIEVQRRLHSETTFGDQSFSFTGDSGPLYPPFAVLWVGALLLYIAVIGSIIAAIGVGNLGDPANLETSPQQGVIIFAVVVLAFLIWSILSSWYQAKKLVHFARCTSFDNARFTLNVTGFGLIGLFLTNLLITVFSLGILSPVAQARALKYFVDRMSIQGTIDFARITQSQAALGRGGEGLAQAFDVDAF